MHFLENVPPLALFGAPKCIETVDAIFEILRFVQSPNSPFAFISGSFNVQICNEYSENWRAAICKQCKNAKSITNSTTRQTKDA